MPPAGDMAIVRDGAACVGEGGVAIADPECGCGEPVCSGCPCCSDGQVRHCAPPGVAVGESNIQRVVASAEQDITFTSAPPSNAAYAIDQDADARCGSFGVSVPNLGVFRTVEFADFPSDPGLKWWDHLRIRSGDALAADVDFYSRPAATWWTYNGLDQNTPAGPNPGGPGSRSAAVVMNPCLTYCSIVYDENGPGYTMQRRASFAVGGTWLPCPSSADGECEGCLDGFGPAEPA